MLVLKAFVNHDEIEEIWVQNVGHVGGDSYIYKIHKPEGEWDTISHERSDGWKKLAVKVLELLEEEG